jgi:hypothetical protein
MPDDRGRGMTKAFQLQATGIDKSCGSLAALNSIDFAVNSAKAVGIVGLQLLPHGTIVKPGKFGRKQGRKRSMMAAHQPLFKTRGIRVNADVDRAGRAGTPADIAPPILFLCSHAARWSKGQTLATDGGLEAAALGDINHF